MGLVAIWITFFIIWTATVQSFNANDLKTYIIHVDSGDAGSFGSVQELEKWYHSFLPGKESRIVYRYRNVIKGFAARLTAEEIQEIQKHDSFLHATPQRNLALQTTHSPAFLGLRPNFGFWKESNYGKGVIIGIVDTGIFPEHPSFSDEGMPPPPAKWKGKCEFNSSFACNNKIIGARYFTIGGGTPLDVDGHGTYTASTAAGNFVAGAGFFDQAKGTAAGIAPLAHLSIYKVCSGGRDCSESDVLAAMDAAVDDGVDVLSLSLGWNSVPFTFDAVALGAYSAVQRGIFVSCSATNRGPGYGTVSNAAPWILTVGASTMDRILSSVLKLGNEEQIDGETIWQPKNFPPTALPLVDPAEINPENPTARFCLPKSFNRSAVRGKVVLCQRLETSLVVQAREVIRSGGAAMILVEEESDGATKTLIVLSIPTIQISYLDGVKIKSYIKSTSNPTATISFKGTVIGDNRAPIVASFSSRGPNLESPGILKPDIVGPGDNILAAWPVSFEGHTGTKLNFLIGSGTSISCPHLSGVAALLKSAHPDWSPAALKSAIMTTADVVNLAHDPILDQKLLPADIFATGSGHVNPSRANNPGLIYDIEPDDYIPYLCGLKYTDREVAIITQKQVNCSQVSKIPEAQLNYPSFSIFFAPGDGVQTYTRTVTNVGEANTSYVVKISSPLGAEVAVKPDKLDFLEQKQKLTYQVTFTRLPLADNVNFSQGFLEWNSDKYLVRSPIVVTMIGQEKSLNL